MAASRAFPFAYHITFGTYGTRLHGDSRGTVDRSANKFGEPIIGQNEEWNSEELSLLRFPRRILTVEQRIEIERVIPTICERGGWEYIVSAALPDHVHNLISANVDGKDVRKWLKRWISESLSGIWPLEPDEVWWAECGSVKWVWERDYFDRVETYVRQQRTTT